MRRWPLSVGEKKKALCAAMHKTPLIIFKRPLWLPLLFTDCERLKTLGTREKKSWRLLDFIYDFLSLHDIFDTYFYRISPVQNVVRGHTLRLCLFSVSSLFMHLQRR